MDYVPINRSRFVSLRIKKGTAFRTVNRLCRVSSKTLSNAEGAAGSIPLLVSDENSETQI